MFAGIQIFCFAASYTLAWLLELARVLWGKRVPRLATMVAATAGLVAHSLFLWHRAAQTGDGTPLSSWSDWYLVAAWILAAVYFFLAAYHPENPLGLFLLPGVMLLVAAGGLSKNRTPLPRAEAEQAWGWLHGVFLLLGVVVVLCGFLFGLMYLWQAQRLRQKRLPTVGFRLPSLEWLQRMNERTIVASVLLLGIGFLAGIVSNVVHRGQALVAWTDPVVWSSGILVAWMAAAAVFQVAYRPAREGRKVAYLTVFSFLFLILTLAIIKLVDPSHGGKESPANTQPHRAVNHPAISDQLVSHQLVSDQLVSDQQEGSLLIADKLMAESLPSHPLPGSFPSWLMASEPSQERP